MDNDDKPKARTIKVTGNGAPLRRIEPSADVVEIDTSLPVEYPYDPWRGPNFPLTTTKQDHINERDERIRDMYKWDEAALVKRISRQFRIPIQTVREIIVPRDSPKVTYDLYETTEGSKLKKSESERGMRAFVLSRLSKKGEEYAEILFLCIDYGDWDDVLSGKELIEWANK